MTELIGKLERALRLERLDSASDLFRARTVYITALAFFVTQAFNGMQMYAAYGGLTLDHLTLAIAIGVVSGVAVSLRWSVNFDFFALIWGIMLLLGIFASAMPTHVGINSALLPNLVCGIVLIALLSSLRSLMLYCLCVVLMVAVLHLNAADADIAVMSDPAYIAERNLQRTMQAGIVVVLIASIMGTVTLSLKALFKTLEDKIQTAEALIEAKTQFLADMSHELRTPLNGVLGMNQLLLRSDLDETQRNYAEIVKECGSGMIMVIDDVLDLARLDGGKVELKPTAFNPAKMLESIIALHQANASAKDVELHLSIQPSLPDMFVGDHGRLRQIIGNLVSNAVKFTDMGYVALSLRGEPMTQSRSGDWWLNIFVQDSGIGITPERRKRIFDRFEQAEDGQKNTVRGSGLGLAICKELTELFGGEISVRSAPGKGSVFCVALPLQALETPETLPAPSLAPPPSVPARPLPSIAVPSAAANS